MTETEVAFAPTRLGARRRRLPPVGVGVAIVGLLVLAVAKPWATGAGSAATPTGSGAAGIAGRTAPVAGLPSLSPEVPAASGPIVAFPGPPRPGAWGIGVGLDPPGDATGAWAMWSAWIPLDPVSERPEPPIRDPLPMETDCSSVPTVAAAPTIVGITVPEGMSTEFSILGWYSAGGSLTEPLDDYVSRLDLPGRDPVASLARRDGLAFPDGRYELHILTPDHVTALGFCLESGTPPRPAQGSRDPAITAQIVAALTTRSGEWGVGTGGNGPRLVREEPWTDWVAVEPAADDGSGLGVWPDTGLCTATQVLLNHPSLVAVTVPRGLVPDWRVAGWWSDGPHIVSLTGAIRQISPPGNRGITYLERVDGAAWPDGRYEFVVTAGDHVTSMSACIGTP